MSTPNYMTPDGAKKLSEEMARLRAERPRVVQEVADAAAQGDRSENAEYIYRKRQLRQIDSRIRFLMKRMAIAEVIDPSQHKGDKVTFGCQVTVEDDSGRPLRYQIVGVDESEPKEGRISWSSPIGRALVGKQVDDTVSVQVAAGHRELTIVEMSFPSGEAAGSDGTSIADAMLAAQRALQENPEPTGETGDQDVG